MILLALAHLRMAWPGLCQCIEMHSDGPEAIPCRPAIRVMVNAGGAYLQWLGLFVNMHKSYIRTVNFADGLPVATDHQIVLICMALHSASNCSMYPIDINILAFI